MSSSNCARRPGTSAKISPSKSFAVLGINFHGMVLHSGEFKGEGVRMGIDVEICNNENNGELVYQLEDIGGGIIVHKSMSVRLRTFGVQNLL